MNHVALITAVRQLHFTLFEMVWHSDHFYEFSRAGLNYLIVASQTELGYFLIPFDRHGSYLFAVGNVIAKGTMTNLAGYRFMHPGFVNGSYRFMACEAGLIGSQFNGDVHLVFYVSPSVVPILTH